MNEITLLAQSKKRFNWGNVFWIVTVLLIITRIFFWSIYKVNGHSMDPTLHDGNYMIALKQFSINRGDIVTAKENEKIITKRVIGLPNDTITFKNDELYINGKKYSEPYLDSFKKEFEKDRLHENYSYNPDFQTRAAQMSHFTVDYNWKSDFSVKLGKNEYYLLGDNRPVSQDSRKVGAFSRKDIIGKVVLNRINFW